MSQKEPSISLWYLITSDIYIGQQDYTLVWEVLNKASTGVPTICDAYTEILYKKRMTFERLKHSIQRQDILTLFPEFEIHLTNMSADPMFQAVLGERGEHLQVLDLRGNTLLSDNIICNTSAFKNLKSFIIKECFGLTCKGIEQLITTSPLLERVDLSCLTVINNDTLYALSNCTRLQVLILFYCKLSLMSEDMVKYFIDKRKGALKSVVLDYAIDISTDLQLYIFKSIKRGIV
jgi:hypothetical protein